MLKYIIPFKTLSNISCEIRLEEANYSGEPIELKAGAVPFSIQIDESDLITPVRSSGATIEVYGSDYLHDLYTSDPQGIKVTLLAGGVVKWLGYLTPDTFSQDFSSPEFIYEMEAVAAFSTLKYKKFDLTADFVSFMDIVNKAIEYSGYSGYYLTTSVMAGSESYYSLKIPSANFYDELGDPMTYYEAMEEIAKYGVLLTWVPFGDKLYLIDYKAQREGYNSYLTEDGAVTLSDIKDVRDYRGTGAKISRIPGKNKATVNSSLYEIKDLIPEFDDAKSSVFSIDPMTEYTDVIKINKENVEYRGIIRRYNQPKFTFFHYANGNPAYPIDAVSPPILTSTGSGFVRTAEFRTDSPPSSLSMKNEVQVKMALGYSSAAAGYLKNTSPVIRFKSEKQVLVHKNVWFCLGLSFRYAHMEWAKDITGLDYSSKSDIVIQQRAKLRIGEYYYNGSSWVKRDSTFSAPVTIKKKSGLLSTTFSIDNKNTYDKGLGDLTGYVFKAPYFPVIGDVELTIYATPPPIIVLNPIYKDFIQYMYYSDIELAYSIPDESSIYGDWVDKDSKNDIVYENEISYDYVEEADDIELKICTNPDGKLALSSVMKGNDFLTEVTHPVYGTGKPENLILLKMTDIYGSPRFAISPTLKNDAKPYSVYIEPHLNRVYMVAGGEEDVKMESCTYNLIEL
ncbi:MAG TPA: hypothetical protein DEP71_07580 [Porphyromonadaceae bacterium]|nr:hypothetical protein [Porphyromonadaceae bacterium]